MAMTYDAFLDQMKKDLEAGFAEDLPAKYSQVKIGIRDVEKLQGESYRGISISMVIYYGLRVRDLSGKMFWGFFILIMKDRIQSSPGQSIRSKNSHFERDTTKNHKTNSII